MSGPDDDADREARVGLCATCRHARRIVSAKGSEFWRCTHPDLPKYPQLPVRHCPGYQSQEEIS